MSTPAMIGIENKNKSVTAIFVELDGRPDGVGKELSKSYSTPAKAKSLFGKGSLESLGSTIKSSEFCMMDGEEEEDCEIKNEYKYKSKKKFAEAAGDLYSDIGVEWLFLFSSITEDKGEWLVHSCNEFDALFLMKMI